MFSLPEHELIRQRKPLPEWWNEEATWAEEKRKKIGAHKRKRGELQTAMLSYLKKKSGHWVSISEIKKEFDIPISSYIRRSLLSLVAKGILSVRKATKPHPIRCEYRYEKRGI